MYVMASPGAKTIRQIMDPEGTLPDVALRLDESTLQPRGSGPRTYDIMHGDEVVGGATLVEMRNSRSREAYFNGVNVDEKLRGQGFGLATYVAAIEHAHAQGETFRTHDWSQTEAAAKVWGRFIDAGVAEVIRPFTPVGEHSGTMLYDGHTQIPPVLHAEAGGGDQGVGIGGGSA